MGHPYAASAGGLARSNVQRPAGVTSKGVRRKRRHHGTKNAYYPVDGRVVTDYVEPENLRDEWDYATV